MPLPCCSCGRRAKYPNLVRSLGSPRSGLEAREARAGRKKTEARERTEEQKAAATKRAAQREERVANGLTELDRFLADQLRQGLATHAGDRSRRLEHMAARMVDAQAPGIASRLRELATVPLVGRLAHPGGRWIWFPPSPSRGLGRP